MAALIHQTAIVHAGAQLGENVAVGPYTIIGEHVEIGDNTIVGPHVVISGRTRIGCENRIFQFCSLGEVPQDKKYAGEPTCLEIGDRNTIREFCSFNLGTALDAGVTRVGDDNWIMAYVHIAHDCVVGDRTIFANGASLAGHVHIEDDVVLGGFALIYQFTRLGAHSFCGFACGVNRDVPPYVTVAGYRAEPYGINAEGLRRRGFTDEEIQAIRRAYKAIYRANLRLEEAVEKVREMTKDWPCLHILADFLAASSRNGIVR